MVSNVTDKRAASAVELLAQGGLDELRAVSDDVVQHGDNVYITVRDWEADVSPERVAQALGERLAQAGAVPADGEEGLVRPLPGQRAVVIAYREQSPDLGIILSIVGALGLGTLAFFIFRPAPGDGETFFRNADGSLKPMPLILAGGAALLVVGGGILFLMSRGNPALASGRR